MAKRDEGLTTRTLDDAPAGSSRSTGEREGLYSSHLSVWRAARKRGEPAGLTPRPRGPQAKPVDPRDKKLVEQAREIARLQARLERAEGLIAVQNKNAQILGHPSRERREHVMQTVTEMAPRLGIARTCAALGLPRATYYRGQQPRPEPKPRPAPVRALPPEERAQVLAVLHEPRFVDLAPAEVYATLLDEDRYLCSERTFYRVLGANAEVRERRDQLRHPHYAAPEMLATRPNELWSWDITKLLGPSKWTYYYLYVVLDVFSRYTVGWMLAEAESARLAEKLIAESCERQGIAPGQPTVHADRGAAMTSKPVAPWKPISSTSGLGSSQGRFQVSDVRSPLNGLRDDALLAHALHCRRLAAYLPIARMRWAQSVRAKAQGWEVRDERLDWPDPELPHIRLHRTIYYSFGSR